MRLFVVGATGGTGKEIRSQAAARGHAVTAFGRSKRNDVVGGVIDASALAAAMNEHDAVLSAIGGGLFDSSIRTGSARAILEAMGRTGIRRFIAMSSTLNESSGRARILSHSLFYAPAKDQRTMEELVTAAEVDWIIIRPPVLTNGPLTGNARVADANSGRSSVSRADVATLMIDLAEGGSRKRQIVWVA